MIKETLNKIKLAEENALKSVDEAKKEKENRISDFKNICDKEWENLKIKLVETESEILEKYRNEAEEENKKIEIRQKQELNAIEKISLKKDDIVKMLITDILKYRNSKDSATNSKSEMLNSKQTLNTKISNSK